MCLTYTLKLASDIPSSAFPVIPATGEWHVREADDRRPPTKRYDYDYDYDYCYYCCCCYYYWPT